MSAIRMGGGPSRPARDGLKQSTERCGGMSDIRMGGGPSRPARDGLKQSTERCGGMSAIRMGGEHYTHYSPGWSPTLHSTHATHLGGVPHYTVHTPLTWVLSGRAVRCARQ